MGGGCEEGGRKRGRKRKEEVNRRAPEQCNPSGRGEVWKDAKLILKNIKYIKKKSHPLPQTTSNLETEKNA